MHTQVGEKIKYAKWKASSIAKAIKEGRDPEPGPAGGLPAAPAQDSEETAIVAAAVAAAAIEARSPDGQSLPNGGPAPSDEDGANDSSDDVRRQLLPDTPGNMPRVDNDSGDDGGEGDETLPSAPVGFSGARTGSASSRGDLPSIPDDFQVGRGASSPSASIPPHTLPAPPSPPPAAVQSPPPPPITISRPSGPPPSVPVAAGAALPSVPLPQPSAPPMHQQNGIAQGNNNNDDDEGDWKPAPANVDPTTIANAQKHAKWAISALNYEDLETARKELKLALQLIGG